MTQQISPWLEGAYGWSFGESGWNSGMDTNLLKFSFMFDRNVDDIVESLPPAVDGKAYYLTTDNRLYFAVGTTYFSAPVPKWFTIILRDTGVTWQYDGNVLVQTEGVSGLTDRVEELELTVSSLGTAALEDVEFFATQASLDVLEANTQSALGEQRTVESFGAIGDGVSNDTPAIQAALNWFGQKGGRTIKFAHGATYLQGLGDVEVIYEAGSYYPARFDLEDVLNSRIEGNGAVIVADPTLPDNQFNRGFNFVRCHGLSIDSLTYDGRLDARTPYGGDLFNGGNELTGNAKSGFSFLDCHDVRLNQVVSNRSMMDGFFWGSVGRYTGGCLNPSTYKCKANQNYRQGSSNVNCSYGTFVHSKFTNTGGLGIGKGTLPMAGMDIESNFDDVFCTGNIIIGGEFSGNLDGLIFSRSAQYNQVIGALFIENRGRGIASSTDSPTTVGNQVRGGLVVQTTPSSETEKYALYIGGNSTKIEGVDVRVSDPHRGSVFVNLPQTQNCVIENCNIEDVGVAGGLFNQTLANITPSTLNCQIRNTRLANATGASGWNAIIGSPSASFIGNRVVSVHGESGGWGVNITNASRVFDNFGSGTKLTGTANSAVFNVSGGATTVDQCGPNIDIANPRVGSQIRRVGFIANVVEYTDVSYDLPSVSANTTLPVSFSVTGAKIGDSVFVDLQTTQDIYCVGRVTAEGTVRVFFVNPTALEINVAPATLRIRVSAP